MVGIQLVERLVRDELGLRNGLGFKLRQNCVVVSAEARKLILAGGQNGFEAKIVGLAGM